MSGSEEEEWGLEADEGRAARSAGAGFRRVDAAGRGKPARARRRRARRPPRAWRKTPATTLARGASAENRVSLGWRANACEWRGREVVGRARTHLVRDARVRRLDRLLKAMPELHGRARAAGGVASDAGARRSSAKAKHNERNKSDPLEAVNSKRATSARRTPTTIQSAKPEKRAESVWMRSRGPRAVRSRGNALSSIF